MNFVQETLEAMFQSPRSGKFVSNFLASGMKTFGAGSFNPLDQGNLYRINSSNRQPNS